MGKVINLYNDNRPQIKKVKTRDGYETFLPENFATGRSYEEVKEAVRETTGLADCELTRLMWNHITEEGLMYMNDAYKAFILCNVDKAKKILLQAQANKQVLQGFEFRHQLFIATREGKPPLILEG